MYRLEVESGEPVRELFLAMHNNTVGHRDLHATLRALQGSGRTLARMSRDAARWIAECPTCQKYCLGNQPMVAVPSPDCDVSNF